MRLPVITVFIFLFIFIFAISSYTQEKKALPETVQVDSAQAVVFKSKSPMGALLRSAAFPGWGQFYNRKYIKVGLVFGAETTFLTLMAIEWKRMDEHRKLFISLPEDHPDKFWEYDQYKFYQDRKNLFLWSTIATIFVSMFDAYVDAHLYDFDKEMERIGLEIYPDSENRFSFKLSLKL
jgi:hypothetical protein